MFTFHLNDLPLSVYNFGDYYFDYHELKKFTSSKKPKSRETKLTSVKMSLQRKQDRYMTIDQTLVYVMCAPREMLKRIFHYAKWVRAPNNYKRYYELITKPASVRRKIEINVESSAHDNDHVNFAIMDWYNFMQDFRAYFGIEIQ